MRINVMRTLAIARAASLGVVATGLAASVASCESSNGTAAVSVGPGRGDALDAGGARDATTGPRDAALDSALLDGSAPCTTRISYGAAWVKPQGHPDAFDDVVGLVTWGGACANDGANSYATLSNGFKPYFSGHDACLIALDQRGACASPPPPCTTRVTYGPAWLPPANHPTSYDDVPGRVFTDGACQDSAMSSFAVLSNGFRPTFAGNAACALSLEYVQCGGLYGNPVIPIDCPDPGVLLDGTTYVLSCTSGNAANAFPIYTSTDLVTWKAAGHILPAGTAPAWAKSDFWAPEIHHVGAHYVAYFSARNVDGVLSIGAASAPTALGPFVPLAAPLIHDPNMGLIDASEIETASGAFVLWKEDGNAAGKPTPIHAQPLTADGLALTGAPSTLITNDQAWEGPLVEAPFMVEHAGAFYLFYSGNAYNTGSYAVGVAKASAPTGPFTKTLNPILVSGGAWAGPGHCAVVDTPAGDTYVVYHAWESGAIGGPPGRLVLTDAVRWQASGPTFPFAPSSASRPLP